MKTKLKIMSISSIVMLALFVSYLVFEGVNTKTTVKAKVENTTFYENGFEVLSNAAKSAEKARKEEIRKTMIVYDNLTMDELSNKLERSMNSSLKGKGKLFAEYSIKLGLDPYLALAITLHETGCAYNCSWLTKTHYNLGGLKGSNGKYMSFSSMDEGIKQYLNILYNRYYSKGLTTPELMNPYYAESTTWASNVNNYIRKIKAA